MISLGAPAVRALTAFGNQKRGAATLPKIGRHRDISTQQTPTLFLVIRKMLNLFLTAHHTTEPTMVELPTDVVFEIAKALRHSILDLRSITAVSKRWHLATQTTLHRRTCVIGPEGQHNRDGCPEHFGFFIRNLLALPYIAQMVVELDMSGHSTTLTLQQFLLILRSLPRMKHLLLHRLNVSYGRLPAGIQAAGQLDSLSVDAVCFDSCQTFVDFFKCIHHVSHLQLYAISMAEPIQTTLTGKGLDVFLEWNPPAKHVAVWRSSFLNALVQSLNNEQSSYTLPFESLRILSTNPQTICTGLNMLLLCPNVTVLELQSGKVRKFSQSDCMYFYLHCCYDATLTIIFRGCSVQDEGIIPAASPEITFVCATAGL